MIRTAVIGIGNMGSKYASMILDGKIQGLSLAAITRIRSSSSQPAYSKLRALSLDGKLPVFESADTLFEAVEKGELKLDAVIITTPHYSHEEISVRAFKNGLHVLCEKPSGVYSRQARNMEAAADSAGKVFSMVFHFRTMPIYTELKKLVASGKYGKLKKMRWLITDWYRPEGYYKTSSWHSTWETDGGGVILNQCPHNLDLLQWICGMPSAIQGFCHEGKYHDIEVEDDVTAYFEWTDGATGTFVSSTGDAPGVNRLELFMDEALIICEDGKLRIGELQQEMGKSEAEYRRTSTEFFKPIKGTWHEITPPEETSPYEKLLQGFADECSGKVLDSSDKQAAPDGREGRKSLLISNAIYLSSWEKKMVELPKIGSKEELQFEKAFESALRKRCVEA